MTLITDKKVREAKETLRQHQHQKRLERKREKRERDKGLVREHGQRDPRIENKGYLQYIRRQPCLIGWGCSGRIDPAHQRFTRRDVGRTNPGMGTRSHDSYCVPLCRTHHEDQHKRGNEAAWWAAWCIDPDAASADLKADYDAGGHHGEQIVLGYRAAASKALASGNEEVAAPVQARAPGGNLFPSSPFPNRKEANRG